MNSSRKATTARARAALLALLLLAAAALSATSFITIAAPAPPEPEQPQDGAILEYSPPKPGVDFTEQELRAHALTFTPRTLRTPLALEPLAIDWSHGDHKALAILAEFSDVAHSSYGKAYYDDKMNYNGTARASARSFFYENSLGNYTLNVTVTDWVTLPNTQAYYDTYTGRLVGDAATAANAQIDFSQFDWDSDGYVDNLMVIHSGGDQASGCTPNCIWSHAGSGNRVSVDGKYVQNYATVADFGHPWGDSLGVWIHEFGHLGLNLPDLYDTQYDNDGLGPYDMMAGGSWYLNHFSAWCKDYLGWIDPYVPPFNLDPYTIYPSIDVARYNAVKVTTNYTNEYFLLEMRYASGSARYDTGIPNDGLMIFHIDSNTMNQYMPYNAVMYNTAHKGIDIEEDGAQDLDTYGGGGYGNDMWKSDFVGFTPTSTPNTNLYVNNGNYATGISVYNISAVLTAGGTHMTFSLNTGRINFGLYGQVLGAPEKEVAPGSAVTYPVEISTLASTGDTVSLSLEGVNQSQGSLDRTLLVLPPYGSAMVNLTVSVPSWWSAGDPAWVQVRATSTTMSSNNFVVSTITRASQIYSVDILDAAQLDFPATPDVDYSTWFTVRNLGNGADNVSVSVTYDPAQIFVSVVTQPGIIGRGASTAVPIELLVAPTVLYQTSIPVQFDLRFGSSSGYQHLGFTATVTADKLGLVAIELQAPTVVNLIPGQPRVYNVTVRNLGNYDATYDLTASAPQGVAALFDLSLLAVPAFGAGAMGVSVVAGLNATAWSTGLVWFTATSQDLGVAAAANLSVQVTQRFELAVTGDSAFTARPGGNALFNLVAVNLGNGPDDVEVSFLPLFVEWNPSLSDRALSLDTTTSNRTRPFEFRVSVPEGAPGNLLQLFTVTVRSTMSGTVATMEVTVLVLPVYAFEVTADAAQGAISGTERASFLLNFHNRGNVRDSYSVTVDGLPEGWTLEFAEGSVATVMAKGTGQTTLIVRPAAGAAADRYDFQIFAASEGNLSRPAVIPLNVTIVAYREIQVRGGIVDGDVRPGATVTVHLVVSNLGNVIESLYFQPTGPFASMTVDPLQVSVPPFEERVVTVVAVLRNDQTAGLTRLVITAAAVNNAAVTAEGTVEITVGSVPAPPPSTPGIEAGAAVAALASAAGMGVVASGRRARR